VVLYRVSESRAASRKDDLDFCYLLMCEGTQLDSDGIEIIIGYTSRKEAG